jgi:hypothetical protein
MPMPELKDNPDEEIRDNLEVVRGQARYLVKWTGWPSEYNQWVDEADMANAQASR